MSKLDYSKIALQNEQCTHLTKRLNRLSTWAFFKVLYRNDMMKMWLTNILMLVFFVPTIVAYFYNSFALTNLSGSLPMFGSLGMGTGIWKGVNTYYDSQALLLNNEFHLWLTLALLALCFVLSGGFGVIRDAFWTGKLTVFKSFALGIRNSIFYSLVCVSILSLAYYGVYVLQAFLLATLPAWLAIILIVLSYILLFLIAMYCFILVAVTTTYQQSVGANLRDAWLLMWMNFLPNIIKLIFALIPIALLPILKSGSFLTTLLLVVLMFFGVFYILLVWMTHMMKTFALFHPVKKAKE